MARRYTRDNRGRFSSFGATARGGRLATASGNKRATQTARISSGRGAGTIAKPKGLQPQSSRSLRTGVAINRQRSINEKIGKGPDLAQVNIRGRFTGQAGKRYDAGLDRAVKQVNAAQTAALMKPKAQVKAERAAAAQAKREAAALKPKRTRTPESMRVSRAKKVLKEREMKITGTLRQWENSKQTQERALAYYKKRK
jgi:hypothetical protein